MTVYAFDSDNAAPACPQVMAAIIACNQGSAPAYGDDALTAGLNQAYSAAFERECHIYPVGTGTAGNALALAAITPPYGTIFCHADSHIATTECGAAEFYCGGARLCLLPGDHGKIAAETLQAALDAHGIGSVHHMEASALSLTQASEAGAAYTLDELRTLCDIAHAHHLKTHMDGARFANALVHLDATPAEMSWRTGVDILTLGATKNGAMNTEAVVAFDADTAARLRFLHKRGGHLSSNMRFAAAQLHAMLEDGLWRSNAAAANAAAERLRAALKQCPGAELVHPPDINEVFVRLSDAAAESLASQGWRFRLWEETADGGIYRLVASCSEEECSLQAFAEACASTAGSTPSAAATASTRKAA